MQKFRCLFFISLLIFFNLPIFSSDNLNEYDYILLKEEVKESLKNSWCSDAKIDLLMDLTHRIRPSICVEVGAFVGSSVLPVAVTLKYLTIGKMYAVDAWSNQVAVKYLADDDANKKWWSELDLNNVQRTFEDMIASWGLENFCVEICQSSELAAEFIPDNIDFLHLDGDFSEMGSLRDVQVYVPKVRSGGYILLSNFYMMNKREQPKVKAFCLLCENCEVIATIEHDNTVLFQKN